MTRTPTVKSGAAETTAPGWKRWPVIIAMACSAGTAIALAVVLGGKAMSDDRPRLNADTLTLVKYACTDDYAKLSFDRQSQLMMVLEDREDNGELDQLFESGLMTEEQYRTAKLEAWLGEQLKRSEKYAGLPAGSMRVKFISDLLDRKAKKAVAEQKEKATRSGSRASAQPEVKRDDTVEQLRIKAWPEDVRRQWEEFRRAYEDQKQAREKAAGEPVGS